MTAAAQPDAVPTTHGLTGAEVAERVTLGQVNDVPARSGRSTVDIVRSNVLTRFNAIISVLFVVIAVVGPIQDGLFGLVVVANTAVGIAQELRAKRTLDALAVLAEARPRVRREGGTVTVSPRALVVDDVCELASGDQVPVDGTVLEADGLEMDESLLTGESEPVHKLVGDPVMSGSFVAAGDGAFRATRVGRDAYAARLTEEASRYTLTGSQLRRGVDRILTYVTRLMVPIGILLVLSQFATTSSVPEALRGMVAGLVTMVPEGLVLLTSVAFAVGVVRLGRRGCLVQELPAVEGLARVDTVCLDKTGTLTEGGMDVEEVRPLHPGLPVDDALGALAATDPHPNASMRAIAARQRHDPQWPVRSVRPFSSARKWSGAAFGDGHGGWLLGAPDVLLPPGHAVLADVDLLGSRGLRVLLLATTAGALDDAAGRDAHPAALVVLRQRTRPDAAETLRYFADQGVRCKVVSGDSALAVGAVATALALPGADHPVDARDLPADDHRRLAAVLDDNSVFGRVTPQQKRDMVAALHTRQHTVAMTGDGVNDVLALKDADVGVAMGTGSGAARAVAQIVLLEDRFSVLPSVVAEGRRVIGNVERVANLFLTKTVYAMLLALLVGVFTVPFPFLPRQLTLIGTLTIGTPSFFLALAPGAERARGDFVRRVLFFAVPTGVVAALCTFAAYGFARLQGGSLPQERTAAAITLFLVTLWALVVVARPWELWKAVLVALMAAGFLLALFVPFLAHFFALYPGRGYGDGIAVGIGLVGALLVELCRRLSTRALARRDAHAACG